MKRWLAGWLLVGCGPAPAQATPPADEQAAPADASRPTTVVQGIAVGLQHACVRTAGGAAVCWGRNRNAEMGAGSVSRRCRPLQVPGVDNVRELATGPRSTCALVGPATVACWGAHPLAPKRPDGSAGVQTLEFPERLEQIAIASGHGCVRAASGSVYCWGRHVSAEPQKVSVEGAVKIDVSRGMSCAALRNGEVTCWLPNRAPTSFGNHRARDLAATADRPCTIDGAGNVNCWAEVGRPARRATPALPIPISHAIQLNAGGASALVCAVTESSECNPERCTAGPLQCWNLANANPPRGTPFAREGDVPHLVRTVALSNGDLKEGRDHLGCVVAADGVPRCWRVDGTSPDNEALAPIAVGKWAEEPAKACDGFDGDGDGIEDEDDRCPDGAEVWNGVSDDDGCTDDPASLVIVDDVDREIRLVQPIQFELGKGTIRPESFPVLDHLAAVLLGQSRILKIEIQGHTDSRGERDFGRRLSDRRADSVREYLLRKGVERERVHAQGYGDTRPITHSDRNRRIEVKILELD